MSDMINTKAVGSVTLIGVSGKPPFPSGNCFNLIGEDDKTYKIVNFNHENLEHLMKQGLTFPIQIKILSGIIAVLHDKRIGNRWYSKSFCEVCCPDRLLPITQQLSHERDIEAGIRKEGKSFVQHDFRIKYEFE